MSSETSGGLSGGQELQPAPQSVPLAGPTTSSGRSHGGNDFSGLPDKRLWAQFSYGNSAVARSLQNNNSDEDGFRPADIPLASQTARSIQRNHGNYAAGAFVQGKEKGRANDENSGAANPATQPAATATHETTAPATVPTQALIVEDNAETLQAGQMRKSQFLAQLRSAVCVATAQALAGTAWSEAGCPYIERVFAYYANLGSQHLERAIRRFDPGTDGVTNAAGFIPLITSRVRSSVTTWATTGRITGVPEDLPMGLPGMLGGTGGDVADAASGIANAASSAIAGIGSAIASVGNLLFKHRNGSANEVHDPQAIQSQLGAGHSLDAGVRGRMESAFGESFGDVQIHRDHDGAELSEDLNARAFTVGQHIAFGRGEYQPGTLIGDALIAHELAHVMQQRGGAAMPGPAQKGAVGNDGLEADADEAAVGAIVSIWSGETGRLKKLAQRAKPSLMSGLKLQRCSCSGGERQPEAAIGPMPDYDAFSYPDGRMKDGAASLSMMRNWQQLERVYADAANNNRRAIRFIQDLEETMAASGTEVANIAYSARCSTPVVRELTGCEPNWAYFNFLRRDKPSGVRILQVVGDAYAQRSRVLRVRNSIIMHGLQLLGAGVMVRGAMAGAGRTVVTGEGATGVGAAAVVAETSGFTAAESAVIAEARTILSAPEMATIRSAQAAGKSVTLRVNGRLIQYEPAAPVSGMTIFEENGFLIGREAFVSETELAKTILHELYRLSASTLRGTGTGAGVAAETEAAFSFAERAFPALSQ